MLLKEHISPSTLLKKYRNSLKRFGNNDDYNQILTAVKIFENT